MYTTKRLVGEIAKTAVVLLFGLCALVLAYGCAPVKVQPVDPPKVVAPAPAKVVAVFIFVDHCTEKFGEAAFVRSDGSITETSDPKAAAELDKGLSDDNGRVVPMYIGECGQTL
jgi:hypothetical protein